MTDGASCYLVLTIYIKVGMAVLKGPPVKKILMCIELGRKIFSEKHMNIPVISILFDNMNIEELREYCLSKKAVEESFPFDEQTLVFKVLGKMFLLTGLEYQPLQFNVKCDPEHAEALREKYSCVLPGYHMSKKHWNTVICNRIAPDKLLKDWIDHSYDLVVSGLTKKQKLELENFE